MEELLTIRYFDFQPGVNKALGLRVQFHPKEGPRQPGVMARGSSGPLPPTCALLGQRVGGVPVPCSCHPTSGWQAPGLQPEHRVSDQQALCPPGQRARLHTHTCTHTDPCSHMRVHTPPTFTRTLKLTRQTPARFLGVPSPPCLNLSLWDRPTKEGATLALGGAELFLGQGAPWP